MATVDLFTGVFAEIDSSVIDTIQVGSANMIALISPLIAVCFSLYILLITYGYWRGNLDDPIQDFLTRMLLWAVVLTFGMNISYYSNHVPPFFNGIGNEIASAINGTPTTGTALDSVATKYLGYCADLWDNATGVEGTVEAVIWIAGIFVAAMLLLAISAAYIILAKVALAILLAIGPFFISMALFPATRKFFDAWLGQCLNYVFLTVLFSFAGNIQVNIINHMIANAGGSPLAYAVIFRIIGMAVIFIFVLLNLPSLASALAGGVGISSMVGKAMMPLSLLARGSGAGSSSPVRGGSISHAAAGTRKKLFDED